MGVLMPLVSSPKRMVYHNFEDGTPRFPILFFRNEEEHLYEDNAILDTGANLIVIPDYIFDWFKNRSYKITETKDKNTEKPIWIINDVSFKIESENGCIIYENEKIYYAPNPNIRVTSIGIHPIFEDFDVAIKARIKTIILDLI